MNDIIPFAFNTPDSNVDSRTVQHGDLVAAGLAPRVKGGYDYLPTDIENQERVGICTGISNEQERRKTTGKKYSADFQYLMQKIYDGNWLEGSSIFTGLRVAKNIGFLPAELWTWTTEADRKGTYADYIAKLQAIPQAEIDRLKTLCIDKIAGYAQVDVSDHQAIAAAIDNSKAGILCRYSVGAEWWTGRDGVRTFDPLKLNPILPPAIFISGHAIIMSKYDYTTILMQFLANTWGSEWNNQGVGYTDFNIYKPTEAWVVLETLPPLPPFQFRNDLAYSMTSNDVKVLQQILNKNPQTQVSVTGDGSLGHETNYFGNLTLAAVKKFQALNHLPATGYVGTLTRALLNSKYL